MTTLTHTWRRWRPAQRGTVIALILSVLMVWTVFAFILQAVMPFSGSIFDTGKMVITTSYTNDDGTQTESTGFDEGDNGNDPIGPASLVGPGYDPAVSRATSNIQSCTATVNGSDSIDVDMTDALNDTTVTTCAVKFRVDNQSTLDMVYDGVTVTGTAVGIMDISQDPDVGTCIPSGNEPFLHFEMTPNPASLPGDSFLNTEATITAEFHDVSSCP